MQETVTNSNDRKSLFTSFLDVLEAQEKKAQAERQLQEEKYLRRTQRIHDLHERQRGDVAELRRCVELVSQHAAALEGVLRGAGAGGAGGATGAPLAAALLRPAAALQRCMAQCVRDATHIRDHLAAAHRQHMDHLLAKMHGELQRWSGFMQRVLDVTCGSEILFDNIHNMIAEQRQCAREVAASALFAELEEGAGGAAEGAAAGEGGAPSPPRRAPSVACSTPIARD